MVQRLAYKYCLVNKDADEKNFTGMKKMRANLILSVIMVMATVIGWVKGNEARQKWVYKWKTSYDEKRQLAKKRMEARMGQVQLDDIEWSSFHNN